MAFFSFTRQHRRRRVIFAALLCAAIACGFLGVSSTQLRAQADSYGGDLILLKDAAHVQMNGSQPAYDETGLPIGLDSTADAPIGNFKVGDWVLYRVNVLNRGNGIVNRFTVTDFIPQGITYQESWVRNCDMLNDFTVAPTDHLWVREGHSFDPNNGASGLEDVTFPCKRANPTMPKSFTHCNGQWNAESDTFGLASYATLYILGRVNKDGAGKTITNTAFITSSFTGATVSVPRWSADITVSPLAAGEQVEPVTDPSPCTPPTTETPSPTVSESTTPATPSTTPEPSTSTPTPSTSTSTTQIITPSTSTTPAKPELARTGIGLAVVGGTTLTVATAGAALATRRRRAE